MIFIIRKLCTQGKAHVTSQATSASIVGVTSSDIMCDVTWSHVTQMTCKHQQRHLSPTTRNDARLRRILN